MTTKAPDPADKALDAAADGQFAGGRPGTAEDALRRVRLGYDLRNREARALADYVAELRADRDAARAANERDRTAWDVVFARLRGCVRRWAWVRTGRGPYEWDDDEYRKEFGRFADEITRIVARGEKTTNVHDWSDCPTTQAEVDAARQGIT